MTDNEILLRLTGIFRDVFDDPAIVLDLDTTADDVPGWDSMSQVTLAIEIEHSLSVKFRAAEMEALCSIRQLVELIRPRLPTSTAGAPVHARP